MPTNKAPIIYLSGLGCPKTATIEKETKDWVVRSGCLHRCFSFCFTCEGAFYYQPRAAQMMDVFMALGGKVMMDSSGYSFHRFMYAAGGTISSSKKRKFTDVEQFRADTIKRYMNYCRKNEKSWDFYVNFDYIKDSPTIYAMQTRFEKSGLHPTPIYHGDSSMDWFKRYIDEGHKLIGIATVPKLRKWNMLRRYLDRVHDLAAKHGVGLHGFAMTAPALILQYPWWSVDSSTWLQMAMYGKIYGVDPKYHTITSVHVSNRASGEDQRIENMPKAVQALIKRQVEENGFDFGKIQESTAERQVYNAKIFLKIPELVGLKDYEGRAKWDLLL